MRKKEGARKREPDGRIDTGGNSQSDQEIYESRIRREEIESERIVFALAISAYLFLSNKAPPFE